MNQKFKVKGKQVLLLGLVALVITAGYYRWTVETEKFSSMPVTGEALPENVVEGQNEESGQNLTSLDGLKEERDKARGESIDSWKTIQQSQEASQESKNEADKKIKSATENLEKEKNIETLIKAKGFEDCFVHIDENGVSVVVSGTDVNGAKVAQIKDIIVSETGVSVKNIKISAQ